MHRQSGQPTRARVASRLLLTASFGLATVALPYVRHVNNHILLLGVVAPIMLGVHELADRVAGGRPVCWLVAGIGFLAGVAYTIDLGAGPVVFACMLPLIAWRCRRWQAIVLFLLAASPWLLLHHIVNYAVGGTLGPANAVAAYFNWPGCPFNAGNMTGTLNQITGHFLVYGPALLVGKRGFLGHNLPLFLAVAGMVWLLRQRVAEWPEILFAVGSCAESGSRTG